MVELTLVYGRYNHGILAFIGVYRGLSFFFVGLCGFYIGLYGVQWFFNVRIYGFV